MISAKEDIPRAIHIPVCTGSPVEGDPELFAGTDALDQAAQKQHPEGGCPDPQQGTDHEGDDREQKQRFRFEPGL